MTIETTPEWQLGELAVQAVRAFIIGRGHHVLRTDLIDEGGAPGFMGPNGFITVTDLLVAAKGRLDWHEVKWKTSCVKYQKAPNGPTWRTGIDAGQWRYYLSLQRLTGVKGWLDLVHLRPGPQAEPEPFLLVDSIDNLFGRVHPHSGGGDVKVWWDLDGFLHYPIQVADDWQRINLGPPVVRPWEQRSKSGEAPRWMPPNARTGTP